MLLLAVLLPSIFSIWEDNMQKTASDFTKNEITKTAQSAPIPVKLLERHAQDWLFESEYRNHSPRTIEGKRDVCNKLL